MPRQIDWQRWLGRRLRLQDLHVLLAVIQHGSMAKAANQLGVTQPAVSKVIADLEHSLGVRLLDRSPQGVQPTIYGRALIKRSSAAFYELKQSVLEIEFLADPTRGELRIGCSNAFSASILPPIMHSFSQRYPRVALFVNDTRPAPRPDLPALRDGKHDLILGRVASLPGQDLIDDDLNVETLFDDGLVLATGAQKKIDLAELIDEPWILPVPDSWNSTSVMNAFKARGLGMPKITLIATSLPLRAHFLRQGPYIAPFARGNLLPIANQYSLKVLKVDLPVPSASMAVITLKGRTLSPVAERFIEHLRASTHLLRSRPK